MAMHKLYIVLVRWVGVPLNPPAVDNILTEQGEWIRFNSFTWFLWTDASPMAINQALLTKLGQESSIIIASLETRAAVGWAPKWIWDWLNDKMVKQLTGG